MRSFRSSLAAAVCAVAVVGGGTAFAGEVKGPPGSPGESARLGTRHGGTETRQLDLRLSGLNDFRAENGQIEVITQSPGTEHRLGKFLQASGKECNGHLNPKH